MDREIFYTACNLIVFLPDELLCKVSFFMYLILIKIRKEKQNIASYKCVFLGFTQYLYTFGTLSILQTHFVTEIVDKDFNKGFLDAFQYTLKLMLLFLHVSFLETCKSYALSKKVFIEFEFIQKSGWKI